MIADWTTTTAFFNSWSKGSCADEFVVSRSATSESLTKDLICVGIERTISVATAREYLQPKPHALPLENSCHFPEPAKRQSLVPFERGNNGAAREPEERHHIQPREG